MPDFIETLYQKGIFISTALLNSFELSLKGNSDFMESCDWTLTTDEMLNSVGFPCVFMFITKSGRLEDFLNCGWEYSEVTFSIMGDANTPNIKLKLIEIEDYIYSYLNMNKNFESELYDRGQVACISRGIPEIFDFEDRSYILLSPQYTLTGWRQNPVGDKQYDFTGNKDGVKTEPNPNPAI